MLELHFGLQDLDLGQLIRVYAQSIREQAAQNYNGLYAYEQLLLSEQDFYSFLREFFRIPGAFYAIWLVDGQYVSALRMEPYQEGLLLEGLETDPTQRHRGYARQLVEATLQHFASLHRTRIYSHVSKTNLASLAVHTACGFQRIMDHAVYVDGSVLHSSCTMCYDIPDKLQ